MVSINRFNIKARCLEKKNENLIDSKSLLKIDLINK